MIELPERHAWLAWSGDPHDAPTASGRPIPAQTIEWAALPERLGRATEDRNDELVRAGWHAAIPLETGVTALLASAYAGWLEAKQAWQWSPPSLTAVVVIAWDDPEGIGREFNTNDLPLKLINDEEGAHWETSAGCRGYWCEGGCGHHSKEHYVELHADEDVWWMVRRWSAIPLVRRDAYQQVNR